MNVPSITDAGLPFSAAGTPPGITASQRPHIDADALSTPVVTPRGAKSLRAHAGRVMRSFKQLLLPSRARNDAPLAVSPTEARVPVEILEEILGHIEAPKALADLAAANRYVRNLVMLHRTPEVSRQRSALIIQHAEGPEDLRSMLSHCRDVWNRGVEPSKVLALLDFFKTAKPGDLQNTRSIEIYLPQGSLVLVLAGDPGYSDTNVPTGIYSKLAKALKNLSAKRDVSIAVKLNGGRFAGSIVLREAAQSAASVTQFVVKGSGDGRRGEKALAKAITRSRGKLTVVDLDKIQVNGAPLLSKLRKVGNGITHLSMPSSRTDPSAVAETLQSPNNKLEELSVGLQGGDVQSLVDALRHPTCKLASLSLTLHTGVSAPEREALTTAAAAAHVRLRLLPGSAAV